MSKYKFTKMHGAGNDFIIIEDEKLSIKEYSKLAEKTCDRHFGVGADGFIVVQNSKIADVKWLFINSDGSIGEMCGNGIRCFSNYVYEKKIVQSTEFTVETMAGIKNISIENSYENNRMIKVDMGKFELEASNVPVITENEFLINESVSINNEIYTLSSVRMGVPHTVLIVNRLDEMNVIEMGKTIEKASMFPEKTNVNFVEIVNENEIKLDTWERGAGHTLACGTGACSAVYISYLLGLVGKNVTVRVRGGELFIELNGKNVYMKGKAEFICEGIIC